jgi:hypothetical protein
MFSKFSIALFLALIVASAAWAFTMAQANADQQAMATLDCCQRGDVCCLVQASCCTSSRAVKKEGSCCVTVESCCPGASCCVVSE